MGDAILMGQGGKKIKTQSKTVTPTASTQTVLPDENMLLDSVIVNGDSNLIPSNIKSGVSIFGVTGNVTPATHIVEVGSRNPGTNQDYVNLGIAPTSVSGRTIRSTTGRVVGLIQNNMRITAFTNDSSITETNAVNGTRVTCSSLKTSGQTFTYVAIQEL